MKITCLASIPTLFTTNISKTDQPGNLVQIQIKIPKLPILQNRPTPYPSVLKINTIYATYWQYKIHARFSRNEKEYQTFHNFFHLTYKYLPV